MTALTLNGQPYDLSPGATLVDLVGELTDRPLTTEGAPADGGRLGIAVAVDSVVVPRSRWHATVPGDGQHVEVITAMQGG